MTSHPAAPGRYAARLHPAAGIGAASAWSIPSTPSGYEPYLVLPYHVGSETFHRVWAYHREIAGEANYVFLGDTSVSLPGSVAPDLQRIAVSALPLTPGLRATGRAPGLADPMSRSAPASALV